MPFCVQCGARLEDDAKFCTVCGAKQPIVEAPAYVPAAEEKPAEPQGYGYAPSAAYGQDRQESFGYDPTIYSAGGGGGTTPPGKKKGGVIALIILAAVVVLGAAAFLIYSLTAGGKAPADDPVLGVYSAQKAETTGMTISIRTMWKNDFTIELKKGGRAALNVDGKTGSAKWKLDGNRFTIKGSGIDCSGTLSDGTLILENVLDSGITLYFAKDGVPSLSQAPASAAEKNVSGLYNADKAVAFGRECEISDMWEKGISIELKDDGTCGISINGINTSGSWSKSGDTVTFDVPGFNMDGTLKDGVLILENVYDMGVTLYFTKDGSMRPDAASSSLPESASEYGWWNGDWYGWWYISDAGGRYSSSDENWVDLSWDACARISVDGSRGHFECWDEDNDFVAAGDVIFSAGLSDKGCMSSQSVEFWDYKVPANEWSADPGDEDLKAYPNSIVIFGRYQDPESEGSWFDYTIFLRPWGVRWEDIREGTRPEFYTNWYLPLIEAGESMPLEFDLPD